MFDLNVTLAILVAASRVYFPAGQVDRPLRMVVVRVSDGHSIDRPLAEIDQSIACFDQTLAGFLFSPVFS